MPLINCFILSGFYFLKQFRVHKIERKVEKFPNPPHMYNLLYYQIPPPDQPICYDR